MSATAQLAPYFIQTFYDSNGNPLAGGQLFSYVAGTSTPQATYTDASAGTPNANPTILNSAGQASIWILPGVGYKFILEDVNNNVIATVDNVYDIIPLSITSAMIADGAVGSTQIADGAVGTDELAASAVTGPKIATGAVGSTQIADGAVGLPELATGLDLTQVGTPVEIVFKRTSDVHSGMRIEGIPQFPWSAPVLMNNPDTIAGAASNFLNSAAWSPDGQFLAMSSNNTPFVLIYQRTGTALNKLANPAILPAGSGSGVAWSPNGDLLAVGHAGSPFISVYERSGVNFNLLVPENDMGGTVGGCSFSPNGEFLCVTNFVSSSPCADIYQIGKAADNLFLFTISTSTTLALGDTYSTAGTTYTSLCTLSSQSGQLLLMSGSGAPEGTGTLTQVSGSGTASVAFTAAIRIASNTRLKWLSGALSTSVSTQSGFSASWSPDSQFVAITTNLTPFLYLFQRTNLTFTGLPSPSTLPPANTTAQCSAWSPDGQFLAVGCDGTPYFIIYQVSGTTFTAITTPSTIPTSAVGSIEWSPNGLYLALALASTPFILIYSRPSLSSTTFTAMTVPASLPAGNGLGISWSPDNQFLAIATNTSPFVNWYQTASLRPAKGLLYSRTFNNV